MDPELSFDRAEYESPLSDCTVCRKDITGGYFRVNGQRVCAGCTAVLQAAEGDGRGGVARLLKAAVFGGVAAVLCSAIWYAILTLTGYEIGLLAIAVGFVVGFAVSFGSEQRGGWAYQLLAVVLTYSAIVVTYVPSIAESLQTAEAVESQGVDGAPDASVAGGVPPEAAEPLPAIVAFVIAVPLAYAMPLLSFFDNVGSGILGLIIIGIGLWEAWKINKKSVLEVDGPHELSAG